MKQVRGVLFGVLFAVTMLAAVPAQAQTNATTRDFFAWDLAVALGEAQTYTFTYEMDGAIHQGPLSVTCIDGITPNSTVCRTPVPALTPGTHTLRVRSTVLIDGTEFHSEFSAPLTFSFRAEPVTPAGVRIERIPVSTPAP